MQKKIRRVPDVQFRGYDRGGQTDTQTQTDTLITILRSHIGGGVITEYTENGQLAARVQRVNSVNLRV